MMEINVLPIGEKSKIGSQKGHFSFLLL